MNNVRFSPFSRSPVFEGSNWGRFITRKRNILCIVHTKKKRDSWPLPMNMNYTLKITRVKGTPTTETKRSSIGF
jgi:hypothetical protein